MKRTFRILVLYYSQSGKSKEILDCFLGPLRDDSQIAINEVAIVPETPYPLPWPKLYFFSIFPECAYEVPTKLVEPAFDPDDDYDMVILGSQVWFLSISIPIVSFLKHPKSRVLRNKPVITVLSCRKMWTCTQQRLEHHISRLGGQLLGKVLVTAQGAQMETLAATKDNLFEAKDRPKPRERRREWVVSELALKQTEQQGKDLLEAIKSDRLSQGDIFNVPSFAFADITYSHPENVARNSFLAWGKWMRRFSKEKSVFRYMLTVIFLFGFFIKVFVGLPLWPIVQKFRKAPAGPEAC